MSTDILFEVRGPVLVITFNRPSQGNALNSHMAKAMSEKLKAIGEDRSLRAVLLRGNGDHFMNGHDMTPYVKGDLNAIQDQVYQKVQFFYNTIREMQTMERPVISAVSGRVMGAGMSFMLASDLVIAARSTIFNTGFISQAMVPDGGITFFLPRKVGATRAAELLFLSEDFSVENAEKWGLINRIVDDAVLQAEGLAWAEKLASGPTRIIGAAKRLIGRSFEQDLNAQLSIEATAWSAGTKTFDFRETMKSFAANREPKFTGS